MSKFNFGEYYKIEEIKRHTKILSESIQDRYGYKDEPFYLLGSTPKEILFFRREFNPFCGTDEIFILDHVWNKTIKEFPITDQEF